VSQSRLTGALIELAATAIPRQWILPVTNAVCVGEPGKYFMFGGVGMAAAIAALEMSFGHPVIYAAAQFLSYARPPSELLLSVEPLVVGNHTTQASVTATVDGVPILRVSAGVGSRPSDMSQQWVKPLDMPAPGACEEVLLWPRQTGTMSARIEYRMAAGRYGGGERTGEISKNGQMAAWLRRRDLDPVTVRDLAIFADYLPSAIGAALGTSRVGGSSLDNTIRFHRLMPTQWVLCVAHITAIDAGLAHGEMHLFAEDGTLMASAGQSMIIRRFAA
jgi:acyl-CoA thioesterase-2